MFKSLFQKLFFTYLSVLALVTLVLSVTVSALADDYVYNAKHDLLDSVADKTIAAANKYASGDVSQTELNETINAMGYIANAKIYVVQASADVLGEVDLGDKLSGQYIRDALASVLSGERVFLRRQYSEGFNAQVLFAAYPWDDGAGNIRGAILLFSPEENISAIVANIRLVTAGTAAAFLLIGGLVIYLVTRRIVRPIKSLDEASRRMARGEAADDVETRGNDETGRLARSFNSMKHKLQQNEALRQELIAGISHDLRTPVTSINGYLSGITEGVIKPEDYPKYLGIIRQETQRLMRLTDEILETAKIRSGSIELNLRRFALAEAADAAVSAHKALAAEKHIRIDMRIDRSLMVRADAQKLEQVFYNLLGNAVKYSGEGAVVEVTAEHVENAVHVCVADTGPGIDTKSLPHIFDRYYRAVPRERAGFGIGLATVKSYVEAHGGRVEAQSETDTERASASRCPINVYKLITL